jgi:hypothetical protein
MTFEEIQRVVERSIYSVRAEQPQLDFQNVHEQTTAHRLAVSLEKEPGLSGWIVDCEYSRSGAELKEAPGVQSYRVTGSPTDRICVDIIVHHRRPAGREDNLLAIEMTRSEPYNAEDDFRLKYLTNQNGAYQYQFGLYININGGDFDCTWYQDGNQVSEAI